MLGLCVLWVLPCCHHKTKWHCGLLITDVFCWALPIEPCFGCIGKRLDISDTNKPMVEPNVLIMCMPN